MLIQSKLIILLNLIILIGIVKLESKKFKCTKNDLNDIKNMGYMIMSNDYVFVFLKDKYLYFKIPVCFHKFNHTRCYVRQIYVVENFKDYRIIPNNKIAGHINLNRDQISTIRITSDLKIYSMDLFNNISSEKLLKKYPNNYNDLTTFIPDYFNSVTFTNYSYTVVSYNTINKSNVLYCFRYDKEGTFNILPENVCKTIQTDTKIKFLVNYIYDSPIYDNMTDFGNSIMIIDDQIKNIDIYFVYWPYNNSLNKTPPFHITFTPNDFFNCHQENILNLNDDQIQGIIYDYKAKLYFLFINRYYIIIDDDLIETRFKLEERYNQLEKHDFEYDTRGLDIDYLITYEYKQRKWVRNIIGSNYLSINLHTLFLIEYNSNIKKLNFIYINNYAPFNHPIKIRFLENCYGSDFVIHKHRFCFDEEYYHDCLHTDIKYRIDDIFRPAGIEYDTPDNVQKFRFIFDLVIDEKFVIFTRTHFFVIYYDSVQLNETEGSRYGQLPYYQFRIKPYEKNTVRKEVNCFYSGCNTATSPTEVPTTLPLKVPTTLSPEVLTTEDTENMLSTKKFTTKLTTKKKFDVDDEVADDKENDKKNRTIKETTIIPKKPIALDNKKIIFSSFILILIIIICFQIYLFFNKRKSRKKSKKINKNAKMSIRKFSVKKLKKSKS